MKTSTGGGGEALEVRERGLRRRHAVEQNALFDEALSQMVDVTGKVGRSAPAADLRRR